MTHDQFVSQIRGALDAAVKDWYKRQAADLHSHMYAYYKRNGMAVWIGEEPLNDTWELLTPQRVSPMLTPDQVYNTLRPLLNNVPILPLDD